MRIHLLLATGLLLLALGAAAQEKAGGAGKAQTVAIIQNHQGRDAEPRHKLTQIEVLERLTAVEVLSKGNGVGETAQLLTTDAAILDLANNPESAGPPLLDIFLDKTRGRDFRANCGDIFSHARTAAPPNYSAPLTNIMRDTKEDSRLRVYAAEFLLRDKHISTSTKSAILSMTEQFLREGKEQANIRLSIFPEFAGDSRAISIMLKELERGGEMGPTLWTLGKLKGRSAVPVIAKLLATQGDNKDFPKSRAYLAIGEIGGTQSYDQLLNYFSAEKDRTMRHVIVYAIGLSRDTRAKDYLLKQLNHAANPYYVSALKGLQYFGDASVLPRLELEIQKGLPPYEELCVKKTMLAIKAGDTNPSW